MLTTYLFWVSGLFLLGNDVPIKQKRSAKGAHLRVRWNVANATRACHGESRKRNTLFLPGPGIKMII